MPGYCGKCNTNYEGSGLDHMDECPGTDSKPVGAACPGCTETRLSNKG